MPSVECRLFVRIHNARHTVQPFRPRIGTPFDCRGNARQHPRITEAVSSMHEPQVLATGHPSTFVHRVVAAAVGLAYPRAIEVRRKPIIRTVI